MFKKSRNHHRIPSLRRPGWDYASDGVYFITICTNPRLPHFGSIRNGEMILSDVGLIAQSLWQDIPNHFAFILLDTFIVMPDHIHGVLIIKKTNGSINDSEPNVKKNVGARFIAPLRLIASLRLIAPPNSNIPTDHYSNIPTDDHSIQMENKGGITGNKNPMFHDNISRVIRWYKGRCTFEFRKILPEFEWQRGFYDKIVRNDDEWDKIQKYIEENPEKWNVDKLEL